MAEARASGAGRSSSSAALGRRLSAGSGLRSIEELRFVVVGACVVDCFVRTPRLPVWGTEREARSIRTTPGGKALNQAVALARLGAQVTAVGVVGDDGLGRDVLAVLAREQIDVSVLETREGVATTACLCFVSDEGESAIVWHIEDDVAVRPANVRAAESAIARADAVLLTFEMPVASIREAIVVARRCGASVFVQPAPPLADVAGAMSLPWDQVDVLVANENEARAVLAGCGVVDVVAADDLAKVLSDRLAVPDVIVTLGELGCVVHAADVSRRYLAHDAVAVDTTGAGDAFIAGLAAHFAAGASGEEVVHAAQAAAARAIQMPGGYQSMPGPT